MRRLGCACITISFRGSRITQVRHAAILNGHLQGSLPRVIDLHRVIDNVHVDMGIPDEPLGDTFALLSPLLSLTPLAGGVQGCVPGVIASLHVGAPLLH